MIVLSCVAVKLLNSARTAQYKSKNRFIRKELELNDVILVPENEPTHSISIFCAKSVLYLSSSFESVLRLVEKTLGGPG